MDIAKPARFFPLITILIAIMVWIANSMAGTPEAKDGPPPEAVTTQNPGIPVDELELLVKPLTKDELIIEADAWLELVKNKVAEVSAAEIAVKQKNKEITQARELKKEIEDAKKTLDEVKEAAKTAQTDTNGEAAKAALAGAEKAEQATEAVAKKIVEIQATAQDAAQDENVKKALEATGVQDPGLKKPLVSAEAEKAVREAQQATKEVIKTAKDTQSAAQKGEHAKEAGKAAKLVINVNDAQQALHVTGEEVKTEVDQTTKALARKMAGTEKLEQITVQTESTVNTETQVKTQILDAVADLRAERTALIDRFNVILNELGAKLGKTPEGKDNEVVVPYRLYANAVGGITVDVSDREAAWATIIGWLKSEEGGIRWAGNILIFLATVFSFWILGRILGKLAEKALGITRSGSILLRDFIVHSVRRVTFIIGLIIGLTALEVNIGPLLALIGATGFVVAFALQSTLSNFASGIMIMLYKPFDVGNVVDVAGVSGVVRSMSLVTTTITTADNQIMVVPNNSIWGNIITNITGSLQRRVDLVFGIGYGDDIGHARKVLADIVDEHPLVLKTPEPTIQVHELAESSVNFICRPWVKTEDYWTVYWDLTRMVKERFDAEGISIPFPQRDVHILEAKPEAPSAAVSSLTSTSSTARGSLADGIDDDGHNGKNG